MQGQYKKFSSGAPVLTEQFTQKLCNFISTFFKQLANRRIGE